MMRKIVVFTGAFAVVMAGTLSAFAQTDSRTTTVMNRARAELDPLGYRAGSFTVSPSMEITESYNDNIFATQSDTKEDFITTIQPAVRAASDWNSHSLQFRGAATIDRYATNSKEDVEEFVAGINGRLDIRRDTNVSAGAEMQYLTEERGSPDDANGVKPTEYTLATGNLGFYNRWNRVSVNAGTRIRQYDYDDVTTTTGVTNNDDRDRNEYRFRLRANYDIQQEYQAFAEAILSASDYDTRVDDNGINRDSEGYEVRLGTRLDFTGLVFGDVFLGYIQRDYDDATLKTIDAVNVGVDMTWNVTKITTLTGVVRRTVSETTLANAAGTVNSSVSGRADHELLRNLLLSGRVELARDEFDGTTREDDYVRGMLQGRYMLNRNFHFTLRYEYTDRSSNTANSDYDRNILFLRVRAQL